MSNSTPYANPPAFHSDDLPPSPPSEATFHIIPVPWETSVSYGGGTANGPNAILHASTQLEAYIDGGIPGKAGLHTTPSVDCEGEAPEILTRIRAATTNVLKLGKTPILLGGEHAMAQFRRLKNQAFPSALFSSTLTPIFETLTKATRIATLA